jgi:CRISPR/Cas system endoribonuclease Cas6 (RAMP superfamily)
LILNKFNITATKYTLWSGNLRLNIFMHSRHKSQEATFVEFLLQGKYHAKDFCFWGSFSYLFLWKNWSFQKVFFWKLLQSRNYTLLKVIFSVKRDSSFPGTIP